MCARGEHQLAKTADELSSRGEVSFLAADVADPGDAERLGLRAVETFPHLSILLNNVSILGKRQAIADVDIATWDDVLRVNTSSLFYITKPLVPHFVERGDGSISNVSSSVGRHGKPNWGPYAVSKFGLEGFTQVLAAELEPRGVRVNSVNRRCCTARSKSLTSLCRLQSHPAQYVSGIPSAAILLSISHPIRCSTRCLANVRARISGPMIAL